jgi:DNA-binding response OmpR family regulator
VWKFDDVVFDDAAGKLEVAGKSVEIDRNCRAILTALLQQVGGEVGKERLLEAGWPNRIVHENSLAKAIGRLRQALGDSGAALETVYGHGYRLKVELLPPEQADPVGPRVDDPLDEPSAPRTKRLPAGILAGGALLALAGVTGTIVLSPPSDTSVPFRKTPPVIADAPDSVGRLLWVDDHPENNIYEARLFESHRIAVHNVTGSVDALRLLAMYDYDVVISDMGRGEDRLAGLNLATQMRARGDQTPLIIYTVRPDGEEAQKAQRDMVADVGAQGVVVTPQEIRAVVLKLFDNLGSRPSR